MSPDELIIPTDTTVLTATLRLPVAPTGLVIVAEGAYARCRSNVGALLAPARDRQPGLGVVSAELSAGITESLHAGDGARRDAMHVLGQRLATMTRWLRIFQRTAGLPVAYFGYDVGAGAACAASVACAREVTCLVTWEGRIDLVGHDLLTRMRAPTLLLLTDRDPDLLAATRSARAHLRVTHATKILRCIDATADDSTLLVRAADYARTWLARRLHEAAGLQRGITLQG